MEGVAACGRETLVVVVIGMAGSGKTRYVTRLSQVLKDMGKSVYIINLDPAVVKVPYTANIDVRDSINYRSIINKYKLGPNGAIMTCLNLFVTRFDKVLEVLERRYRDLDYIIIDTPGQIEAFNWSASATVILESLASSFPTVINYVIDTSRSVSPVTFSANMIYACSVMYKCQLPFLTCFNKIDVMSHERCLTWMKDYDSFYAAVMTSDKHQESYMASFSRSCALMLNEFYADIKTSGVSAKTGEGFREHVEHLQACKLQYQSVYLPWLQERKRQAMAPVEENDINGCDKRECGGHLELK